MSFVHSPELLPLPDTAGFPVFSDRVSILLCFFLHGEPWGFPDVFPVTLDFSVAWRGFRSRAEGAGRGNILPVAFLLFYIFVIYCSGRKYPQWEKIIPMHLPVQCAAASRCFCRSADRDSRQVPRGRHGFVPQVLRTFFPDVSPYSLRAPVF